MADGNTTPACIGAVRAAGCSCAADMSVGLVAVGSRSPGRFPRLQLPPESAAVAGGVGAENHTEPSCSQQSPTRSHVSINSGLANQEVARHCAVFSFCELCPGALPANQSFWSSFDWERYRGPRRRRARFSVDRESIGLGMQCRRMRHACCGTLAPRAAIYLIYRWPGGTPLRRTAL